MLFGKKEKKQPIEEIDIRSLKIPNHLGIIMDGNGRWAKQRNMPRQYGHKCGKDALIKIAKYANTIGIKYMTVYAFSTENWTRPKEEVDFLMDLVAQTFVELIDTIKQDNIVIKVIGERENLSPKLIRLIEKMEATTKDCTGMTLNIAFNYGGRAELVHAFKEIVEKGEEINIDNVGKHLYTSGCGDIDLLIRTSGEVRISNFLLWQISYSEIYICDEYWPDFKEANLKKALLAYTMRDRRFGGIKK